MLAEFREAARAIMRGGEPELAGGVAEFVRIIFDLDAALEMGFTVTLSDVTPIEFRALMVLREERSKAQEEKRSMSEMTARAQANSRGF